MKISIPNPRKMAAAVAMSDVAFLLLIFLIVTVTVEEDGSIALPAFAYTEDLDIPDPVSIQIDKESILYLEERPYGEERLIAYLGINIDRNAVLRIFADKSLYYSVIDKLLSRLKEEGFSRIVLVTEKEYEN